MVDYSHSNLIKERAKALRKFKKYKDEDSLIIYKISRSKVRREIKAEKQKSWIKFITTINSETSDKTIWQNIKKLTAGTNSIDSISAIAKNKR